MSVVVADHPVRITAELLSPVEVTVEGDTLYYGQNEGVTTDVNDGSVPAGGSTTFVGPEWLISAGESVVSLNPAISAEEAEAENWHYVGETGQPVFENSWLNRVSIYNLNLAGATLGTFKIDVTGYGTTANIAFDANAAAIDSALEAVVGAGNASVVETDPNNFKVSFIGDLADEVITATLAAGTPTNIDAGSFDYDEGDPATDHFQPARFYKQADRVYVEGEMTQPGGTGVTGSSATAFTLPVGYRPDRFTISGISIIGTDGTVRRQSSSDPTLQIDTGFSFRAA